MEEDAVGNKEIVGKKMDQGLKEFYFFSES